MHRMVNELYIKQKQLESLLSSLPAGGKYDALKKDGEALLKKMKAWDEDMVQRKSKAYDDVENFPNKFTANYLFLINATESDIPRVNQPSLDRMKELNAQWVSLKARANEINDRDIPACVLLRWTSSLSDDAMKTKYLLHDNTQLCAPSLMKRRIAARRVRL